MKKYRTKSGKVEEKLPGITATVSPSEKVQIAMAGGANTLGDVQTILGQSGKRNNLKGQGAKHIVSFQYEDYEYEAYATPADPGQDPEEGEPSPTGSKPFTMTDLTAMQDSSPTPSGGGDDWGSVLDWQKGRKESKEPQTKLDLTLGHFPTVDYIGNKTKRRAAAQKQLEIPLGDPIEVKDTRPQGVATESPFARQNLQDLIAKDDIENTKKDPGQDPEGDTDIAKYSTPDWSPVIQQAAFMTDRPFSMSNVPVAGFYTQTTYADAPHRDVDRWSAGSALGDVVSAVTGIPGLGSVGKAIDPGSRMDDLKDPSGWEHLIADPPKEPFTPTPTPDDGGVETPACPKGSTKSASGICLPITSNNTTLAVVNEKDTRATRKQLRNRPERQAY